MKILAALRDNAANYYRTQCPFLVLKQMGYDVEIKVPNIGEAARYDVLWLQMHADPATDIVIRQFKDAGKTVVYDVDDWLFEMPPSWNGYDQFFRRGVDSRAERMILFERALEMADLITCTTEYLATKLREKVSIPVAVLPNCVMMGDWDVLPDTQHEQDGPVLGWFGTGNHWDDWMEIAGAVDVVLEEVSGHLALMGAPEVLSCFPERLRSRTLISPIVSMRNFHEMRMLIKACDVGLAWATDRLEASKCRSPLKALQWGAAGVPVMASKTVYGDILKDSYVSPLALQRSLVSLLEQVPYPKQKLAEQWQQVVWERHSYETQSMRWHEVLESFHKGEI